MSLFLSKELLVHSYFSFVVLGGFASTPDYVFSHLDVFLAGRWEQCGVHALQAGDHRVTSLRPSQVRARHEELHEVGQRKTDPDPSRLGKSLPIYSESSQRLTFY